MKKFLLRVLTFSVAIPSILAIILWLNFYHFLLLNLWIIAFSAIGALEARKFFIAPGVMGPPWLTAFLSASFPALVYLTLWFPELSRFHEIWLVAVVLFIFIKTTFRDIKKDFSKLMPLLSGGLVVVLYSGWLFSYFPRIMEFKGADMALLLFIALVFGNDIFAYLGGRFLGGKTKMNLAISPNKSLVGFISGFIGTILIGLGFYFAFPNMFNTHIIFPILLFALIALITILGDLLESAMKRASGIKDSGTIMAGRGGVLDSIDSMIISAPFFYFLFPLISG